MSVKLQNEFYVSCILYGCGWINYVSVQIPLSNDTSLSQQQVMYKNKSMSYLAGKIRFSGKQIIMSYHHMETSLGIMIVISW